jgi:hypothetical protein
MSAPATIAIDAVVHDVERPALEAACRQLAECLEAASGGHWIVRVRFHDSASDDHIDGSPLVVASLLRDIERAHEPLEAIERRWRRELAALAATPSRTILLCTILRCLASVEDRDALLGPVERIRRLNLLAINLSHELGIGVADIDQVLAHVGARPLRTDCRLGGPAAPEIAAYAIVRRLLTLGVDSLIPPAIAERASSVHASRWSPGQVLRRLRRVDESRVA